MKSFSSNPIWLRITGLACGWRLFEGRSAGPLHWPLAHCYPHTQVLSFPNLNTVLVFRFPSSFEISEFSDTLLPSSFFSPASSDEISGKEDCLYKILLSLKEQDRVPEGWSIWEMRNVKMEKN